MFVTRYNPERRMREFRRGFDLLNSMLDDFSQSGDSDTSYVDFTPAINSREGEFAYHIELDLPGAKKEDIDISVEGNRLIISGKREFKKELKEENYYKIESSFGSFSRSFELPEGVDVENIKANSEDGVLEVVIPKLKKENTDKVKKIAIN